MKKETLYGFIATMLLLLFSKSNALTESNSSRDCNAQPISKIILSLCSSLIKEIGGENNFFFSPLSIAAALAMIYLGAGGSTKAEMTNVLLQFQVAGEQCIELKLSEEFKHLLSALETKNDAFSFLMANVMFVRHGYQIRSNYTNSLREYFNSGVQYLDFAHEEQLSMETINKWVSNHTNGQIKKLINEPLDHLTIMILMNVIYFKGFWEHPFKKEATLNSFFYKKNGTKIVPFMILQENLNYFFDEDNNCSYLELDYADGSTTMLLILPKHVRDFPQMELTIQGLCAIRGALRPTDLMVILPKFRLEFSRELSKDVSHMGMEEIFSDKADLSGIREQNDIHVSLMLHKAVLEVDENGSEASVATGVGIDGRKRPNDQKTFWANHAFSFFILDKHTNTILFAGRVLDP